MTSPITKTTHTPGPWKVEDGVHIVGKGLHYPETTILIASLSMVHRGDRDANARLIAAAPDLLEALRGMLEWSDPDSVPGDELREAHNIARAALARVESGE